MRVRKSLTAALCILSLAGCAMEVSDESLEVGETEAPLLVRQRIDSSGNRIDSLWSTSQRRSIRYCISDAFGTDAGYSAEFKATLVSTYAEAARVWGNAMDVRVLYLSSEDASCDGANNNVDFDIVPNAALPQTQAKSGFPHFARASRHIQIGPEGIGNYPAQALHELGHMLGFSDSDVLLNNPYRVVTGVDPKPDANGNATVQNDSASIMRSNGGNTALDRLDKLGGQALYGVPFESIGGKILGKPGVASWGPNRLDVFGRGQNNDIWWKKWTGNGWGSWVDLANCGTIADSPAAVSWGANRIDIFARTSSNTIVHCKFDGASASTAVKNPNGALGGGLAAGAIGASSWGSGRLDVFVRGTDNQLYHNAFYSNAWHGFYRPVTGTTLASGPGAVSWGSNRIDVVYQATDNTVRHVYWDGSWHGPSSRGGGVTGDPVVASWGPNRLDIFARGNDGRIYQMWWDGQWSTWQPLGGMAQSGPAVVSWRGPLINGSGRLDMFVRGAANNVEHAYYDEQEPLWKLQH